MLNRLKQSKILAILLLLSLLSGCVTIYNPATERREMLLIDTAGEVALGQDMDKEIRRKLKVSADPVLQDRADSIGMRIAGASDRKDLTYHFAVVKDKELNAFAIPGGFVYVNSGLMERADDNELAGVIAHEVGHIAARHSIKKLQAAMGYQLIMGIALGVSDQQVMGDALDIVFNLSSLGYGRKDELLADKLSVRYTKRAGFDPMGIVSFFEKLKQDAQRSGPSLTPIFLKSHPAIEERIKNVKNEIGQSP